MIRKEHIIIAILLVIIAILCFLIVTHDNNERPIENAQYCEIIANSSDEPGTVEVIRNIGNPDGEKIAYVVGVHPLERRAHEMLVKELTNTTNLRHSYDIYIINVTEDVGHYGDGSSDDSPGRQNGQNLAYKYVYPEILNGSYKLAVDVHSNVGAYTFKTFVFSPVNEGLAKQYALNVSNECPDISYYAPESTTSGPYLTIPLNENNIPAFYFEEYSFTTQDLMDMHMNELIRAVDNLDI